MGSLRGLRGVLDGEWVVNDSIRGRRLAPNGPKEWMTGSFSSSKSEKSRGSALMLD